MNRALCFSIGLIISVYSTAAWSQERNAGDFGRPEANAQMGEPLTAQDEEILARPPRRSPVISADELRKFRAAPPRLDASGMGIVSHSSTGETTELPASDTVTEALKRENERDLPRPRTDRMRTPKPESDDVEPVEQDTRANRYIFWPDERVRISNTTRYPFSTIVYVSTGCSGTVIGRYHVLTAAHCVYDETNGRWYKNIAVYPGRNGQDAPFGKFRASREFVPSGYVNTEGDHYSSEHMQYDIAVIEFDEPIGSTTGWLSYGYNNGMPDFVANIVGYPGDKPGTMWRASCDIDPTYTEPRRFDHYCDTPGGYSGSGVYDYEKSTDDRMIYGVEIAEWQTAIDEKFNISFRITETWFDWVWDIKHN